MEFRLPELGENIASADVSKVYVAAGDVVVQGAPLLEVETEKASAPVESPVAGRIEQVHVKAGDRIKVGRLLFTIAESAPAGGVADLKPTAATTAEGSPAGGGPSPAISSVSPAPATAVAEAPAAVGAARLEFRLPPLGDGITSADVVKVLVKPGDAIRTGTPLFEVETEKASAPVESPVAGTVQDVLVQPGVKIKPGDLTVVIQATSDPAARNGGSTYPSARRATATVPARSGAARPVARSVVRPSAALAPARIRGDGRGPVPAGPATRRLARELGVDLRLVPGSGRAGRVTLDDVKAFVRNNGGRPFPTTAVEPAVPPLPDFTQWGPIERVAVNAVRRKTAEHLSLAWRTCPQVTQFDLADVTELEAARKRLASSAPAGSAKVTMTVLAIKAVVAVLREMPRFNSSYDPAAGELVYKKYFHIGLAVDTEHGLLVPVVRDADKKTLPELAAEVAELADKARARKLSLEQMRGGTFTITNLGGIGGTAFSPIVNYPEVAILGLARSSQQYLMHEGRPAFRLMLPLCLSYDHRVIDGADAARFTVRLAQVLAEPAKLIG